MAFTRVCGLDELQKGELIEYTVDGQTIALVCVKDAEIIAIQGECPHQQFPLAEGQFDGQRVLTCSAHLWEFDITTGQGINPDDCELVRYPLKVEGKDVYVDVAGVEPKRAGV